MVEVVDNSIPFQGSTENSLGRSLHVQMCLAVLEVRQEELGKQFEDDGRLQSAGECR